MLIEKIPAGDNIPEEVNVIVEISMNSEPIKYEFDKDSGAIFVDRFMQTTMRYPCNYGFIPHTLGGDGDPLDVLIICDYPIISGAVVKCRPIGVLIMEDESGRDEKILALPTAKVDPSLEYISSIDQLNPLLKTKIQHFFEHYKDLDKKKWVKIIGWDNTEKAKSLITQAQNNAQ